MNDDATFYYAITVYIVSFLSIYALQHIVQKIGNRKWDYFMRHLLTFISALLSLVVTIIITIFINNFEWKYKFGSRYGINFSDVYFEIIMIFFISIAFIYGSYRGKRAIQGLPPIIRVPVMYSIIDKPYTTIREAMTLSPYGRRIPSDREVLEWRERSRHFASAKAQWLMLYILYLLIFGEILIGAAVGVIFLNGVSSLIKLFSIQFVKGILMISTLGFIPFILFSFIFHKPIILFLELMSEILGRGATKRDQWILVFVHSVLFIILIIVFVLLISKLDKELNIV